MKSRHVLPVIAALSGPMVGCESPDSSQPQLSDMERSRLESLQIEAVLQSTAALLRTKGLTKEDCLDSELAVETFRRDQRQPEICFDYSPSDEKWGEVVLWTEFNNAAPGDYFVGVRQALEWDSSHQGRGSASGGGTTFHYMDLPYLVYTKLGIYGFEGFEDYQQYGYTMKEKIYLDRLFSLYADQ